MAVNSTKHLRYVLLLILFVWATSSLGFRYVLADLDQYRVLIEQQVEKRTPYRVRIGHLSGRWLLFSPAIQVEKIELLSSLKKVVLVEAPSDELVGATDVTITETAEDVVILSVERVSLEVDLMGSLLSLKPRFRKIVVEGLALAIEENTFDERIIVKGWPIGPQKTLIQQLETLRVILDKHVLSAGEIYLSDTNIQVNVDKLFRGEIYIPSAYLDNQWFNHLLLGDVLFRDDNGLERSLSVKSEFQGNPADYKRVSGRFYVSTDSSDWSDLLNVLDHNEWALLGVEAGVSLWLELRRGYLQSISADISLRNVIAKGFENGAIQNINELDFSLQMQGSLAIESLIERHFVIPAGLEGWTLKLLIENLLWNDKRYTNLTSVMDYQQVIDVDNPLLKTWEDFYFIKQYSRFTKKAVVGEVENMYRVVINEMPLALLHQLSYLIKPLHQHRDLIDEVSPEGRLVGVRAMVLEQVEDCECKKIPDIYGSASAVNIGMADFRTIPGIRGIGAYVEWAPNVLGVMSETRAAKLAQSEYLFRDDVSIKSISGHILLEQLSGDIVVHSDVMQVITDQAKGDFVLSASIPTRFYEDGGREIPAWSLQARLDWLDAQYGKIFFPNRLSDDLLAWIDDFALEGEIAGDIFLFAFAKKREPDTFLTLTADVEFAGMKLDYLPGKWPILENVSGTARMHNQQIVAKVPEAKMFESRLYNGNVVIPSFLFQDLPRIKITGDVSGSLYDAQQLFLQSELKDSIGKVVEDWRVSGTHQSRVEFDFAISNQLYSEPNHLLASVDINEGSIYSESVDLEVSGLHGNLQYSLENGLSAESFSSFLFGKPLLGHVTTSKVGGEEVIQVFAKGEIEQKDLVSWQDFWLFENMHGMTDFEVLMSIGEKSAVNVQAPKLSQSRIFEQKTSDPNNNEFEDSLNSDTILRVDMYSDLQGIEMNLPGSYGKTLAEATPTYLQVDVLDDFLIFRINYHDRIKASLMTVGDDIERGRVHFGDDFFPLPADKGVSVTGSIDALDFDEWMAYLEEKVLPSMDAESKQADEEEVAAILNRIDVTIADFAGFEQRFFDIRAYVVRGNKSWHIDVENNMIKGVFIVPDEELISKENPVLVDLEYLKISEEMLLSETEVAKLDRAQASVATSDKDAAEDEFENILFEREFDLKPEDFLFMKMKIKSVTLGRTRHGRWEIDFSPDEDGMDFHVHQLNYGLMSINGKGRWDYSEASSTTRFKGHVRTAAATRLYSALSLTPSANSRGLLAVDVRWPGDPLSFDPEKMRGKIGLEIFDGSIIEIDIRSKKFRALGIFNLGFINDIVTLRVFKKIGRGLGGILGVDKEDESDEVEDELPGVKND